MDNSVKTDFEILIEYTRRMDEEGFEEALSDLQHSYYQQPEDVIYSDMVEAMAVIWREDPKTMRAHMDENSEGMTEGEKAVALMNTISTQVIGLEKIYSKGDKVLHALLLKTTSNAHENDEMGTLKRGCLIGACLYRAREQGFIPKSSPLNDGFTKKANGDAPEAAPNSGSNVVNNPRKYEF